MARDAQRALRIPREPLTHETPARARPLHADRLRVSLRAAVSHRAAGARLAGTRASRRGTQHLDRVRCAALAARSGTPEAVPSRKPGVCALATAPRCRRA